MNTEAFLFIIAPLTLFVFGTLLIPSFSKNKNKKLNDSFKLINDLEKKYIY